MRGAVAFGLLLGIGGTLSRVFFGDRLAYVILFSLVALSSGAISLVVWRRLRLGLFTVSGLAAAAACGAIASFAWQGYTLETIPAAWLIAIVVALCMTPAGVLFEPSRNREKWEAWRRTGESAGLIDMLLFRHVPDLRNRTFHA